MGALDGVLEGALAGEGRGEGVQPTGGEAGLAPTEDRRQALPSVRGPSLALLAVLLEDGARLHVLLLHLLAAVVHRRGGVGGQRVVAPVLRLQRLDPRLVRADRRELGA